MSNQVKPTLDWSKLSDEQLEGASIGITALEYIYGVKPNSRTKTLIKDLNNEISRRPRIMAKNASFVQQQKQAVQSPIINPHTGKSISQQ